MREWWSRIRAAARRDRLDEDLREEMATHIEMEIEANVELGMSREAATSEAHRQFGNRTTIHETARESWQLPSIESLVQDVRYALRTFRRNLGFTVAVTACLALGIGANTAIFTMIEAVMLRSLPVRDPSTLVQLAHTGSETTVDSSQSESSNYSLFRHIRDRGKTFSGVFQASAGRKTVLIDGSAEIAEVQQVTGSYYEVLGIGAVIGRTIEAQDSTDAGSEPVAVLSHDYWQRRFGGDTNVLGRAIRFESKLYTVLGISEGGFSGIEPGRGADITIPIDGAAQEPGWYSKAIVGRLGAGRTMEQAEAELNILFQPYVQSLKMTPGARAAHFAKLQLKPAGRGLAELRRQFSRPLMALMAIVTLVLIAACANAGSMLLARAAARRRELAIRVALGAGHARITRQLFTEGALLSLMGGAGGLLIASWASYALAKLTPDAGLASILDVTPNAHVLAFTIAVSLAAGVLFSIAPALTPRAIALAPSLTGTRTIAGARPDVRKALILVQLALSVILLAAAGLFVRSLSKLRDIDPGFKGDVQGLSVDARAAGYQDQRLFALQAELLRGLEALPEVRAAAAATIPPLSGNEDGKPVTVAGYEPREGESLVAQVNGVTPRYFDTFGIRILSGRSIQETDIRGSAKVAVVSESLARRYFGAANPVGKYIGFGRLRSQPAGQAEIVGVARDALYRRSLRESPPEMIYIPYAQMSEPEQTLNFAFSKFGAHPEGLANAAIGVVKQAVPTAVVTQVGTARSQVEEILVIERLLAVLGSGFGILCLALTAFGLYGLLSYTVARRTPEIGLRVAFGAQRGRVLWLVLRESLALAAVGTAVGVAASLVILRAASGLLFGITPTDPISIAAAIAFLAVVALAASAIPAARALRVEPAVALRDE